MSAEGLLSILEGYRALSLEDEDGGTLNLEVFPPASAVAIANREESNGIILPAELRTLLLWSDGMRFFDSHIQPLNEQVHFLEQGLVSFHNWGNVDFDCVALPASSYVEGTIVFINHTPEVSVKIADSLSDWFVKVVHEIRQCECLYHPMDYKSQLRDETYRGMYQHVPGFLKDVDCELNR